jgi:hypothetical protein
MSTDPWERREDQFHRHPFLKTAQYVLGAVAIVLVATALIGLASTGSIFFQGEAAKHTVGARTNIKVYSPENKIAQIAFFHNTCNTAKAQLRIVQNNAAKEAADLKAASFASDPIRKQQAQDSLGQDAQDVTGAENVLQTTVADYNSRSAQSTANVFKGANLPDRIVLADPVSNSNIDCG